MITDGDAVDEDFVNSPGVDAVAAGEMIFNNMNMMFTTFVKTEEMTLSGLKASIARQLQPLLQAIRA